MSTTEELRERIEIALEERAFVAGKIGTALGIVRSEGGSVSRQVAAELEEALAICAPKPER